MTLLRHVEAVLFAAPGPVPVTELATLFPDGDADAAERTVAELRAEYEQQGHAFEVREIGGGYQIVTRPEYAPVLERFGAEPPSASLSVAAMETLAIVAYRQPVSRAEVEEIRGVGAGAMLRSLLDRDLVAIVGRGDGLGRPLLYGTSRFFLEHFAFRSIADLPRPDDLPVVLARADEALP